MVRSRFSTAAVILPGILADTVTPYQQTFCINLISFFHFPVDIRQIKTDADTPVDLKLFTAQKAQTGIAQVKCISGKSLLSSLINFAFLTVPIFCYKVALWFVHAESSGYLPAPQIR